MSFKRRIREYGQRPKRREFYRTFMAPGDTVFDIGANVGNRTEVFLDLGANVIAVEPQPECVAILRNKFGPDPRFTVMQKALGSRTGIGKLHLCAANTIASMSGEWIDSVRSSGRFAEHDWNDELVVDMTTMDALISEFGAPEFCKVDVEGFESQVLQGLTRPIKALSFEFTPEFDTNTKDCIAQLERLGHYEFNWSFGESMVLELEEWTNGNDMVALLDQVDRTAFGDIYARIA